MRGAALAAALLVLGAAAYRLGPAALSALSGGGGFDPGRDAGADLRDAAARAKASGRRVLVDVGGDWCGWCRRMEAFFAERADLAALRDRGFVVVRVYAAPSGPLPPALAAFPAPPGFPHLYVLDADGRLLRSQDTSELEAGDSYDPKKVRAFLADWAPAP